MTYASWSSGHPMMSEVLLISRLFPKAVVHQSGPSTSTHRVSRYLSRSSSGDPRQVSCHLHISESACLWGKIPRLCEESGGRKRSRNMPCGSEPSVQLGVLLQTVHLRKMPSESSTKLYLVRLREVDSRSSLPG